MHFSTIAVILAATGAMASPRGGFFGGHRGQGNNQGAQGGNGGNQGGNANAAPSAAPSAAPQSGSGSGTGAGSTNVAGQIPQPGGPTPPQALTANAGNTSPGNVPNAQGLPASLGGTGATLPAAILPAGCAPPFSSKLTPPNKSQVQQAIQAYANDVKTVSTFLDYAAANPSDAGMSGNAIHARNAENDETNHLNTLCSLGPQALGQAQFSQSCQILPNQFFPEVVIDLQNIGDQTANAPNPSLATQLTNKIDQNRCPGVLPRIQGVWNAAAKFANVPSQVLFNPQACKQIAGSLTATGLSNNTNSIMQTAMQLSQGAGLTLFSPQTAA
ncbi:MAG: hypothetical protein M1821_005827 [Bathelium mastoideum]|nr:MAG: hypothetical protein M1821_005827 [Bathelium mastoideum]KAI9683234.1 MAG: hypothetical protein M1822_006099 [Bathelium mastoideum]